VRARSLLSGKNIESQGSREPSGHSVRRWSYDPRIHDREVTVAGKREAEELLLIEEADAWFEYLEATRSQTETRYREIEPWAWARLTQRLRAIRARRARLRPAAA
jgi:hypothetical protein